MKKKSERKRKEMRNFTAIGIYYYAFCAALFFERSIWINYLQSENYTAVQIGVLQSILTVAMFIFELPSGLMTDRFGAKKTMIVGHIFICVYMICMLFNSGYYTLSAGFIAYGIGLSLISGSDQTLLHHVLKEKTYMHKFAIFEAITIFSMALSSFAGGAMTLLSWKWAFIASIAAQVLSILILFGIKTDTREGNRDKERAETAKNNFSVIVSQLKTALRDSKICLLAIAIALFQSSVSVLINFVQFLFSDKSLTAFQSSTSITVSLILSAITSLLVEKITVKTGRARSLFAFLGLQLLVSGLLILHNPIISIVLYCAFKCCFEFSDTSMNVLIHENVPDTVRTSVLSAINTCTAGGMFVETVFVSWLFTKIGVTAGFVLFSVTTIGATILLISVCMDKYGMNLNKKIN